MKLVTIDERPRIKWIGSVDLRRIIWFFMNSGDDILRVEFSNCEYKDPRACYSSLTSSIRYYGCGGVKARFKKGNVYLIKKF